MLADNPEALLRLDTTAQCTVGETNPTSPTGSARLDDADVQRPSEKLRKNQFRRTVRQDASLA